jgi:predicted enzyme related to lactoylglutathione lyase
MALTMAQIVVDCANAESLSGFWSGVLDRPVDAGANPYFATIGRGTPGALMFIQVPEQKQTKNRVYLDLTGANWRQEVDRILALGATAVGEHAEFGTQWVTLRDPEGNEFDVGAGLGETG